MDLLVYRVCRSIHQQLDGRGAFLVGGRWNSPGKAVVYMTQTVSLAALENLVHMSRDDFPVGFVTVNALIPSHLAIEHEEDTNIGGLTPKEFGDCWIAEVRSPVLRVRSAVVPAEFNYLLNPRHPQFAEIKIESVQPFLFDARLFLPTP